MSSALVAGLVAGYAVALPIGPIAVYLVRLGAREPLRISAAAAVGVATTDGAFAAVAALGGVGLERLLRQVSRPLTLIAAVVLIVLAVRTVATAVRPRRGDGSVSQARHPVRAYVSMVALTALNPTTVGYFAAVILGGRASADSVVTGLLFAVGAFVASASWQLVLVESGGMLGRVIAGRRGRLAMAVVSSAIMVGMAVQVL